MSQRLHQTDEADEPGGGQRVAEVRFGRGQGTVRHLPRRGTKRFRQCIDLNGIAQTRAGSVSDDILDVIADHSGAPLHVSYETGLGSTARCRNTVGLPVVVDAAGRNGGIDQIAVPACSGQSFQHHRNDGFPHHGSICPPIECITDTVRREGSRLAHSRERQRRSHHIHACGYGGVALPGPQAQNRLMCCHQCG